MLNRKGRFHNSEDNAELFASALRESFCNVRCWTEGTVFLFEAENAK